MAKRISGIGQNVEYVSSTNKMQIAAIGQNVEYVNTPNYMRISAVGLMVEYVTVIYTGRVQGPAAQ